MRGTYTCPLCHQLWIDDRGLRRHLCFEHYPCRFCPKSYIRVDRHERLMHTMAYAEAERSSAAAGHYVGPMPVRAGEPRA